jgi:uncharacterized protein (DUF302 family)
MTPDGLTILPSARGARETMDRLAAAVAAAGMSVFARIDHAAGAEAAGLTLAPMEALLFGSPKAGTPLMEAAKTTGIDLPLKALVWEDNAGQVWLAYNQPAWIAKRHDLGIGAAPILKAMTDALAKVADAAVLPEAD